MNNDIHTPAQAEARSHRARIFSAAAGSLIALAVLLLAVGYIFLINGRNNESARNGARIEQLTEESKDLNTRIKAFGERDTARTECIHRIDAALARASGDSLNALLDLLVALTVPAGERDPVVMQQKVANIDTAKKAYATVLDAQDSYTVDAPTEPCPV